MKVKFISLLLLYLMACLYAYYLRDKGSRLRPASHLSNNYILYYTLKTITLYIYIIYAI